MTGKHQAGSGRHKRSARRTETSDFVAMLTRLLIAWGDRVGHDPAALVHFRELEQTLVQQTNRGIWTANRAGRYSQNEMARILDVSRQAMAKRIALGELVHASVTEARGGGALVRIGEVRARRARLLAAAAVDDQTGSERELRAAGSDR